MLEFSNLPADVKLEIFDYLVHRIGHIQAKRQDKRHKHRVSAYATVCREWQGFFEPRNFGCLTIRQRDLRMFGKLLTSERRSMLCKVWFRIELPSYSCPSCKVGEDAREIAKNNKIIANAIYDFWSILASWKPDSHGIDLTLLLSIYSPSDREHHFRDHRFMDDTSSYYDFGRIGQHDEYHGWYRDRQVRPGVGPLKRLLGSNMELNLSRVEKCTVTTLPVLDFATELHIPRQFYRAIPGLYLIVRSLPRLHTVRYEPWRAAIPHANDLEHLVAALPRTVKRFSAFEDTSEIFDKWPIVHHQASGIDSLRVASQNFTELDVSFIISAEDFFQPFYPSLNHEGTWWWQDLEYLSLTSAHLNPYVKISDWEGILKAAARAALRMPKLRMMELWHGKRHRLGIFRYTRTGNEALIEWFEGLFKPKRFTAGVIQSWRAVAREYAFGRLRMGIYSRPPYHIKIRGQVLHYLKRGTKTASELSVRQLLWEGYHFRHVRDLPP